VRHAAFGPLLSLITADAVKQIQHGILLFRGITRRRVNLHPAFYAHGLGLIIDALKFAVLDSFARFVETVGRIRKGRFVVWFQFDWSAESTATTACALLSRRSVSFGRCSFAFGRGF
jgi:hypothetical protein